MPRSVRAAALHVCENFPVDRFGATYTALWNALKHLAAGYSAEEKTALFSGTAKRVYRLHVE